MGRDDQHQLVARDHFRFPGLPRQSRLGERKGGVIVIQEIFGIDEHVKGDADRWASLGYEAVAPALAGRARAGVHRAPRTRMGIRAGIGQGMAKDPREQVLADIAACRDYLKGARQGLHRRLLLRRLLRVDRRRRGGLVIAASSYYGSTAQATTRRAAADVPDHRPHLGLRRRHPKLDAASRRRWKSPTLRCAVHIYEDAGHGFNNEDLASPPPASAELACANATSPGALRTRLTGARPVGETIQLTSRGDGYRLRSAYRSHAR